MDAAPYKVDEKTYQEKSDGFFKRTFPAVSAPVAYDSEGREIIVVSDLHIAAGKNDNGVYKGTENFFADEPFGRWLEYLGRIRKTPSALLIINGDLFDFLRVTEYPGWTRRLTLSRRWKRLTKGAVPVSTEQPPAEDIRRQFEEWSDELRQVGLVFSPEDLEASISKKERTYGLETDDYKTIYKLIRIKEGHPVFFRSLARWLLNDNRILITKGNHDLELCQDRVRDYIALMLAKSIAELDAEGSVGGGEPGRSVGGVGPGRSVEHILERIVSPNIRFVDDSVLIDNCFYVEHGHRYDKLTMVTGGRFLREGSTEINIPFGSFFNRYLINRVELYYPFFDKIRPTGNIVPMLIRDNFPLAIRIIFQ